jgi:hypothetical protein
MFRTQRQNIGPSTGCLSRHIFLRSAPMKLTATQTLLAHLPAASKDRQTVLKYRTDAPLDLFNLFRLVGDSIPTRNARGDSRPSFASDLVYHGMPPTFPRSYHERALEMEPPEMVNGRQLFHGTPMDQDEYARKYHPSALLLECAKFCLEKLT